MSGLIKRLSEGSEHLDAFRSHYAVGIRERVLRSKSGNLSITISDSFLGVCFAFEIVTLSLPSQSPLIHVPLFPVGRLQFLPVEEFRYRTSCHDSSRWPERTRNEGISTPVYAQNRLFSRNFTVFRIYLP